MAKPKGKHPEYLVWIDLEMTGTRDLENDRIIELALILTDFSLNEIDTLGPIVIHQSLERMQNMNAWCIEHHGNSGLTQQVLDSKITESMCEDMVMDFLTKYLKDRKWGYLAGNSVHCDKKFIDRFLPRVSHWLSHRIVDVSSIALLFKNWYAEDPVRQQRPQKKYVHRAMDDIRESINELRFYRKSIFKQPKLSSEVTHPKSMGGTGRLPNIPSLDFELDF